MRALVVTGVVGIAFLVLSVTIPHLYARPLQQCAPSTPPPVSGTLVPPTATPRAFFINEVLLVPASQWNCSVQGTDNLINDAWVELYNPHDYPLDLYAVHASLDTGANTLPFYLPFGAAIAPHGFLVLFPDLTMFSTTNEQTVIRLMVEGVIIDQATIPPLMRDQSYARVPDGSALWQLVDHPTIATSNNPATILHKKPTPTRSSLSPTPTGNKNKYRGGGSTDQPELVTGTQPAWQRLHLPTNAQTYVTEGRPPATTSAAQAANNIDMEIPRKILLTLLTIALALTLFWCWRLFRS